jgi:hypothetical protein
MNRKVFIWAPNYTASAENFSYIWEEVDRKAIGIRLYNACVKYKDGREEFLHILDVHLTPESGVMWGYREVRQNAR